MFDLVTKILNKDHLASEARFDLLADMMAGFQANRYQRGNVPSQLGRRTCRAILGLDSKIFASLD